MKLLTQGVALTLLGAGLAAVPALQAQATPADDNGVQAMKSAATGRAVVAANPATDRVRFIRLAGQGDLMPSVQAASRTGAINKADAYLDEYAANFGARPAELAQSEVIAGDTGWSVTFTQSYKGVPVFAGELKAQVNREGDLTSVNGFIAPDLNLSVTPGVTEAAASARALSLVKTDPDGYEDGLPAGFEKGLVVRSADLEVYRTGTTRGIDGVAKLAWVVEVWNKSTVRETLVLDAATNKPLNRWSMIAHALDRELYEASLNNNGTPANPNDDFVDYARVYSEGNDAEFAALNADQRNEALGASESYWMFRNTFGYNSWDGNGGTMYTVNNDPNISCPNANWNGFSTNYCTGVTGDDTVAHEWGHAYTESTSGLIYQWQAGALNEAYSDIWGETVDMLNTRHNEVGEPNSPGGTVLRTPGLCSDYTRSEITMTITAPDTVAGPCNAAPAAFGPQITETPVNGTAVVDDALNGCAPFTNAAAIAGKWVYVDRGVCSFATKAANAEAAGAIGIVIGNNQPGDPFSPSGSAGIYGVMVSQADGTKFKTAGGPVNFTVAAVPAAADPTHRWLSGETDPAFGGAIRDMWNPNCYGDPGKVSDAEYHCDDSDSGGVHVNSGVVNRTFAMLVDGYPGVPAIGLDKAAWLFWHTQLNYLTPSSYFPDLADGLEASCQALRGVSFERVSLGNPVDPDGSDGGLVQPAVVAGGTTAADCAALANAIAETELRLDPAEQCDFQPLLAQGATDLSCGSGTTTTAAFTEDFEDGLTGWTQDEVVEYAGGDGIPWEASDEAPADYEGDVAFGPDPQGGACTEGAGDLTSRNGLISPAITMPAGSTPRVSFDHYVATEAEYDGGNVKVSVNGGAFTLIPADKYLLNAPAGELSADTVPMGEEPAFTGTDGGQLGGSWGTSIIDLTGLATPGQTIKFRFDMGRDGCGGLDGWYVDNVVVEACEKPAPTTPPSPTPTPTPVPSKFDTETLVKVKPKKPEFGQNFKAVATVDSLGGGKTPTGIIKFRLDGKRVGVATLKDGRAVMWFKKNVAIGMHHMVATYKGDATHNFSRDRLRFWVVR
ncbi:M4 family metallopeptidase [Nocardioides sp.]|uniref:M4 family metallopeptidase n=1 Tax=Nocardioides sp. TaxID=35761 RepID=UPI002C5AE238|nr:M4 family metallopeptidase [Nocardioides sp.]HXH78787.1 M4 family metallopeptidase [Nocardioides sp.]